MKAFAYTTDRGDDKQRQLQNILRAIGFEVKLKSYIQRSDGTSKGDWDVGITLDAIEYAQDANVMVLASGDGDFDLLVKKIQADYKIPVEVYGVPQLTAISLIQAAPKYVPIKNPLLLKILECCICAWQSHVYYVAGLICTCVNKSVLFSLSTPRISPVMILLFDIGLYLLAASFVNNFTAHNGT